MKLQAIRGMHDILPAGIHRWQRVEVTIRRTLDAYGYQELRTPIVEVTELFKRSLGEATDIVEKEMYSFTDRNGDPLTLRPEGTASCVRAAIEHGLLDQPQRLWYQGPMFRHERPQKGRYRQFHQFGVEVFGLEGPDIDQEVVLISARLWRSLGIDGLELQLNSLGSPEERAAYRICLVDYLRTHYQALDEDSRRRLETNPLRILDSKNPEMEAVIAGAPDLRAHLGAESQAHFAGLCEGLTQAGMEFRINPRLVRGLDYYNRTVFEWVTSSLGAQGTVCAGGRYDGLVEQLGGRTTPAVGFALGMERLVALTAALEPTTLSDGAPDAYLITQGETAQVQGLLIAEQIRDALPWLRLLTHCGGGSFKGQFKKADRSGASYALVLGPEELTRGTIGIKPLRSADAQATLPLGELIEYLKTQIASHPPR